MFAAGDNFIATSQPNCIRFDRPFFETNNNTEQQQTETEPLFADQTAQQCLFLAASGCIVATLCAIPSSNSNNTNNFPRGLMQQRLTVYEVDISGSSSSSQRNNSSISQLWTCSIPLPLYYDGQQQGSNSYQMPLLPVVMALERGGGINGSVVVGWSSTDLIAVLEPMSNTGRGNNNNSNNNNRYDDENSCSITCCRKRVEHSPTCVALGGDLVFTISGASARLQSWIRSSGEAHREGGILSNLHRVTCFSYESSESILVVGFDSGVVRLLSVDRHAPMVSLCSIDISTMFLSSFSENPSSSTSSTQRLPILTTSYAQRSTGEILIVTSQGTCVLNLRTQQAEEFCEFGFFQENNYNNSSGQSDQAVISSRNDFVVCLLQNNSSNKGLEVVPVEFGVQNSNNYGAVKKQQQQQQMTKNVNNNQNQNIKIPPIISSSSSPTKNISSSISTKMQQQQQQRPTSSRYWHQRIPTEGFNQFPNHLDLSCISSISPITNASNNRNDDDTETVISNSDISLLSLQSQKISTETAKSQFFIPERKQIENLQGWKKATTENHQDEEEVESHFSLAQHSNISYNEQEQKERQQQQQQQQILFAQHNNDDENNDNAEQEQQQDEDEEEIYDDDEDENIVDQEEDSFDQYFGNEIQQQQNHQQQQQQFILQHQQLQMQQQQQNTTSVVDIFENSPIFLLSPATITNNNKQNTTTSTKKPTPKTSTTTRKTTNTGVSATSKTLQTTKKTTSENSEKQEDNNNNNLGGRIQLPLAFHQPFEIQKEKQDPNAKPVMFRRGGPIKSSGYTNNVPWSVLQAEKAKQLKKKQQQQVQQQKKNNNTAGNQILTEIPSIANYNTACGVTSSELEKANTILNSNPLHRSSVTCCGFDLYGNVLVTGSNDGTCHLLKLPVTTKFEGQGISGGSTDATTTATSSSVGTAQLTSNINTNTNNNNNTSDGNSNKTSSSNSAAASSLPILSLDVGVSNFDPTTSKTNNNSNNSNSSWNLFATGSVGGIVSIWVPNSQCGAAPKIQHNFSRDVKSVRLTLRDSLLLVANGGQISSCRFALDLQKKDELHRQQNLSRFQVVHEFNSGAQNVLCLDTFNNFDSSLVAFGTSSKQVGVLDLRRPDSGACWLVEDAHSRPVHSVSLQRCSAFAYDPYSSANEENNNSVFSIFASSSVDNSVKLWDLRTRKVCRVLNKHVNTAVAPLGLCMSPCARYVACGSEDRSIFIYDISMGTILAKMKVSDNAISLKYHPLKTLLVAGLANGKAKMFGEENIK